MVGAGLNGHLAPTEPLPLKSASTPPSSCAPPEPRTPPAVSILDLRSDATASYSLRDELVKGLADGQPRVIPGDSPDDAKYAYTRSIETLALYSDRGLAIYEEITNLKHYYPFPAELEILRQYGDEIASRMFGLPAEVLTGGSLDGDEEPRRNGHGGTNVDSGAHKEKWGDATVGVNNEGVNGSLSMKSAQVGLAVELGSGSLQKTRHLLKSLAKLASTPQAGFSAIEYRAVDVERASLVSTLSQLATQEPECVALSADATGRVIASGITATYDEFLDFLAKNEQSRSTKKSIMWLGSSIGNFNRSDAADFLRNVADNVLMPGDTMLIGVDNCDSAEMIQTAYDDPQGVTRRFILEGVDHAGRTLHGDIDGAGLVSTNFDYVSRWNAQLGRHEAYVRCKVKNLEIPVPASDGESGHTIRLQQNELVAIEVSYKYTHLEARALFNASGLRLVQQWTDSRQLHSLYLVEKPSFFFPLVRSLGVAPLKNACGLPSLQEWETMWTCWDELTMSIIPKDILMTKPIPLRHIILFYTGHIPAFAGIHLCRYFGEPPFEPARFADIFERGIDPSVDDPSKITHSHSKVPTNESEWPTIESILRYQGLVRERIRRVYKEEGERMTRQLARVMFTIYEHEACALCRYTWVKAGTDDLLDRMHAETLVYIAVQADRLNKVPGRSLPDFASLSRFWDSMVESEGEARHGKIDFAASSASVGHDDDDGLDADVGFNSEHEFGWDVENPRRDIDVPAFSIAKIPITNAQYLQWLSTQSAEAVPDLFLASWASPSGPTTDASAILVRTLHGKVPFEFAKQWPAAGSALQLGRFAQAKGGRLPTQGELAVFMKANPPDSATGNVGYTNLHPVPPIAPHRQRDGSIGFGSDGGVWMWTSDVLAPHPGYVASRIYPGYSSDFHDGEHQIIVGGSYATPPRLARPSFVNWYQTKYQYVIAGARVAYDA